ncbi:MAG TPA: mandelate racemase/muconate lactonizing enzyme family protein [Acidimicrobiales bacterium]|nr:mandelate racemase/muconate lactonizing enzyme family protein [Acidimicrobiales bacterium]
MKITAIHPTPVCVPLVEDELWAFGGRRALVSVIVEVSTDEGVVGLGEAPAYPTAEVVLAVLRSLDDLVVGEDPRRIERIVRRIDAVGTWHHVRATSPAIAAVEMACWDIVGKLSGQPLVNLFGGPVRDEVEYFWYLVRKDPDAMRADARVAVERGFNTLYMKVGWDDPRADVEIVEAVRDGAGPGARLRIDANEAWSPAATLRIVRQLERFDLEFVEQPTSARNLAEMAYVRGRLSVPVLANEATWTREDVLAVVQAGAADAVSLDNQMDGGLLNMKRAAGIAEAAGVSAVKHSLGELAIATTAAAHVLASTPNFLHANQSYAALLADDVTPGGALSYERGRLRVPDGPGIGVALDRDRLAAHAERYRTEGAAAGFHDPARLVDTPLIPKR